MTIENIVTCGPATLDFIKGDNPRNYLDTSLKTNKNLLAEARQRRELSVAFADPNHYLWQQKLMDFVGDDPTRARLLLYLPSRALPTAKNLTLEFQSFYQSAWLKLLFDSDPEANFTNGDVLEPGMGPIPCVRKAAHLLSHLIPPSIVSRDFVNKILSHTSDPELIRSLHLGLQKADLPPAPAPLRTFSISQAIAKLQELQKEQIIPTDVSPARQSWLKKSLLEKTTADLSLQVLSDPSTQHKALVHLSKDNPPQPANLLLKYLFSTGFSSPDFINIINNIFSSSDASTKNIIATGLRHHVRLGILSSSLLADLDIPFPSLEQDTYPDPSSNYLQQARQTLATLLQDPDLASAIYPCLLVFGSQVKDIATPGSDLDLAIFARPQVDASYLSDIQSRHPNLVVLRSVQPNQTHLILNGVLIGEDSQTVQLYQGLVRDVVKKVDHPFGSKKLEQDLLLYRLLHRGYQEHYPVSGEAFYDNGYRALATNLFINRVFLPKLV